VFVNNASGALVHADTLRLAWLELHTQDDLLWINGWNYFLLSKKRRYITCTEGEEINSICSAAREKLKN
jgi:hypothetical protein